MNKILTALLVCLTLFAVLSITANAEPDDFYLGDHSDLVTSFSGLENKLGYNKAHSGDVINIGGVKFDKGFGLHCNPAGTETYIEIDISNESYDYFVAFVGMQSYSKDGVFLDWGSAAFRVFGDGQLLAFTDTCKYGDKPVQISCEIKGIKTLKLVQDCVDGHSCDWGVWGDAKLTNTKPEEETMPEPEFTPDKTDKITPDEIIGGDYTYASDMYWTNCASYATNPIMRDANTANEWIFDSAFRIWDKGLGMHASSDGYTTFVEINIKNMGFKKFSSYYGICGSTSVYDISMACVKFAVFGDGKTLFESDAKKYGEAFEYMECDITGVSTLKIAIAGAPSISGAWGTWGGAVLIKNGDGQKILEETLEDITELEYSTTESVTEQSTTAEDVQNTESEVYTDNITTSVTDTETHDETNAETNTEAQSENGCAGNALSITAVILTSVFTLTAVKKRRKSNES